MTIVLRMSHTYHDAIVAYPQIDYTDKITMKGLVETATTRASKWLSYQSIDTAKPMIGQVGGISFNKRRVLALPPDYVLKPLHTDHRGFREVAFYEAVKMASQHGRRGTTGTSTATAAANSSDDRNAAFGAIEKCDAWAMTLAMFLHDAIVAESEHTVVASWKALHKEIDLLKSIAKLTASYYGVVAQNVSPSNPNEVPSSPRTTSEINSDSYLLLSDLTANFSKPCAIDIKIGRQSHEPGASDEKKRREAAKYPSQYEQGFRIVGVRIFDSDHPESDPDGFRQRDKHFGRSLGSRDSVKDALRTFFTSHCHATAYKETLATRSRPAMSSQSLASLTSVEQPQPKETMLRTRALSNVLQQLRAFQRWFEDNKCLAFYSSSIFIVYEGDPNASNKDLVNVKMIDFGHVVRQAGGDPGYLYGVKRLSNMLTEVLEEANDGRSR
jgi:1D-myo-inositol-tetrakisphosphate 5-kinase/inositol-polyphosphate multikinase